MAPLLFTVLLASAGSPADPALLSRIAASNAKLATLYETAEYRVHSRYDNFDAHGAISKTSDVETRMYTRADGVPWEEIVRFDDGGKDETDAHEKKREKQLTSGKWTRADEMPFKNPFDAVQQPRYRYRDLGTDADGRERIAFEPIEAAQDAYVGEAAVDIAAAAVRRISFHPSAYALLVHRIDVSMQFDADTPDGWALSHSEIEAEGGALWLKKHLKITTDISGYAIDAKVTTAPTVAHPAADDPAADPSPSEPRNGAAPSSH